MNTIEMDWQTIDRKVRAIVQFGLATGTSGMRPAEYYQAVIDPNMVSPAGDYIRFGQYKGDELVGWQRVEAMTVCEVLGDIDDEPMASDGYSRRDGAQVVLRAITRG